jgi:branched-chain amino acid transport system ATP-binding protein
MLALHNVNTFYGDNHVLHDISFIVHPREVVAVLGRNGAGKTTLLRTIMGLLPAASGRIVFDGTDLTRLPAYKIPHLGIGYVPQGPGVFPDLTVAENLKVGLVAHGRPAVLPQTVLDLFPTLAERLTQPARRLSGGEQQMLTVARALALHPRLLLMDEPTEGLMPALVATVQAVVRDVAAKGVAVLLVEQRLEVALAVAHRVVVLDTGRVQYSTTPSEIAARPEAVLQSLGIMKTQGH